MTADADLEENLRIADATMPNSLTDLELELVARVNVTYRALLKAGCTGCRYCMPCPSGVDIPMCLDLYNRVVSFGDIKFHNVFRYGLHLGGMGPKKDRAYASQCTNCGKCAEKCPQQLPIPDLLPAVANEFETWWLRLLLLYGRLIFFAKARKGR
jgi:predicted aldo/keto reductase-like oxidoreductase